MRRARFLFAILLVAILTAAGLRLYAWQAAFGYGRYFEQIFRVIGARQFADTADLRHSIFETEPMAAYARRVNSVSWIAADYQVRIQEFEAGILYLSEQAHLPEPERFKSPPPLLKHFRINVPTGDHSDRAIAVATGALLRSYQSQLWPRCLTHSYA